MLEIESFAIAMAKKKNGVFEKLIDNHGDAREPRRLQEKSKLRHFQIMNQLTRIHFSNFYHFFLYSKTQFSDQKNKKPFS